MKKGLIIVSTAVVMALSSCTSIKDTAYTTTPETMVVNMTVADIEVAPEQVTATSTWNWNPFRTIKNHKANADAIALRESGADVLIEPSYEVVKRGLFRGGSVTVTGHPGKYINFRNMTEKDAEVITTLKNGLAVATPMLTTTAPSLVDQLRPKKEPKQPKPKAVNESSINRNILSLILGGMSDPGGTDLGLMFGHQTNKWGWYAKADVCFGKVDDENCTGFSLTGGTIRTLPKNFSIFFGTGVACAMADEGYFNLPVDIGASWCYKKFNLSLMFQPNFGDCGNFKTAIGLGYVF